MADFSVIEEIQKYADGRKSDVARGAETPALAALMVEKFGEGIARIVHLMGADSGDIMREVDRLVREIDPQYPKHHQYRLEARPAGLSDQRRSVLSCQETPASPAPRKTGNIGQDLHSGKLPGWTSLLSLS